MAEALDGTSTGNNRLARPRYNPHPDANQGEIIQALHDTVPCLIIDVSRFLATPDILVWAYDIRLGVWRWTLWEIKTDKGKLTAKQKKIMNDWPEAILLARTSDDILREYGRL